MFCERKESKCFIIKLPRLTTDNKKDKRAASERCAHGNFRSLSSHPGKNAHGHDAPSPRAKVFNPPQKPGGAGGGDLLLTSTRTHPRMVSVLLSVRWLGGLMVLRAYWEPTARVSIRGSPASPPAALGQSEDALHSTPGNSTKLSTHP